MHCGEWNTLESLRRSSADKKKIEQGDIQSTSKIPQYIP